MTPKQQTLLKYPDSTCIKVHSSYYKVYRLVGPKDFQEIFTMGTGKTSSEAWKRALWYIEQQNKADAMLQEVEETSR